jgi:hypothetical protein
MTEVISTFDLDRFKAFAKVAVINKISYTS